MEQPDDSEPGNQPGYCDIQVMIQHKPTKRLQRLPNASGTFRDSITPARFHDESHRFVVVVSENNGDLPVFPTPILSTSWVDVEETFSCATCRSDTDVNSGVGVALDVNVAHCPAVLAADQDLLTTLNDCRISYLTGLFQSRVRYGWSVSDDEHNQ